jgi:methylase of polypeptide subunit release factors
VALDAATARLFRERLAIAESPAAFEAGRALPPGIPERLRRPVVRAELLRRTDDAAALALLFAHGESVASATVRRLIGNELVARLADVGVIADGGGEMRSAFRLTRFLGAWFFADEPHAGADAAMSPGPTTQQLARALPEVRGSRTLDVGTGPGTLAIAMATRGARAIGTDTNRRALALARANATLNDVTIELREGSLLEPVTGERFDLIVAQLPYVTRPTALSGIEYLHGGAYGDELALALATAVPEFLEPDGVSIALFDSPVRPGRSLRDRIGERLTRRTTDLLVLSTPGLPVQWQAIAYAQLEDAALSPRVEELISAYDEHAHGLGITDVPHAFVVHHRPHRPDRPYWSVELSMPAPPAAWEEIASYMRGIDLAARTDDELLRAAVRPRGRARLERSLALDDPARDSTLTIKFEPGSMAASSAVAEAGAALLELLAHDPSVAVALERFGEANRSADEETRAIVVGFVREALARGFLVPV